MRTTSSADKPRERDDTKHLPWCRIVASSRPFGEQEASA